MKNINDSKKWFKKCIISLGAVIVLLLGIFYIFDPYFHFHKPFPFISYRLYEERYINDGISRNFDYNAIITGTSMAQNFKTSEVDKLFGVTSVKETFSGAGYKELAENLDRALQRNEDLDTVIWTMDYNGFIRDKDWNQYEGFPTYLYDDNPWNDVSYIFNKTVWYRGVLNNVIMTLTGKPSTTFDEYSSWDKETGLKYIMQNYERHEEPLEMIPGLTDEERVMVTENIAENIVRVVNKYPDTTFHIFYTPYSVCWWDYTIREGLIDMHFESELIATELLLECPNVRLYNFNDKYEVTTNLNYYRDKEHYSAEINTKILEWISNGEGLVTKQNYKDIIEREKEYYLNYDYESIFK